MIEQLKQPKTRKWLYMISVAITGLLGVYGWIDGQQIAAWNILAAAVLAVAAHNTSTGKHAKEQDRVL